jgi:hypothetical protein
MTSNLLGWLNIRRTAASFAPFPLYVRDSRPT